MPDNIFQKYNEELFKAEITPRTRESMAWFQNKVNEITSVDRQGLFRSYNPSSRFYVGNMVMFFYDPKYEKTLPYYDKFPLVIIIDDARGGFLGLNLHYLPIDLRARFLFNLLEFTTDDKFDEDTRFKITYRYLKSVRNMRYFKPCIKKYLTKKIKGNLAIINSEDWEVASFLPTENFKKKSKNFVHKKSREMVR